MKKKTDLQIVMVILLGIILVLLILNIKFPINYVLVDCPEVVCQETVCEVLGNYIVYYDRQIVAEGWLDGGSKYLQTYGYSNGSLHEILIWINVTSEKIEIVDSNPFWKLHWTNLTNLSLR